jgi:RNA polymerase sigma factor (sigma-70 family)
LEKLIEQTFKNEKSRLIQFIRSKILLEEDVEDIFQDVFYKVVVNANILESIDNLIGWIYTVTKNKIIDFYRTKKKPTVSINNNENNLILEELIEDTVIDIEDDFLKSVLYDEIIEAINDLPDEQKKVFIENEIEGKTFKELSKETGVSINTLLARKRYAVLNLKKKLQDIKELIDE